MPTRERFDREPPRTFFTPAPAPIAAPPPVYVPHHPVQDVRTGGYGAPGGVTGAAGGNQDIRPVGGGVDEKLFVGGLPEGATDDFLWGMMAPYGRVAEVKILRKSGAAPCGFVSFVNFGEAQIAVQALTNCRFTVKFADSKGTKRPANVAFEDAFERRVRWA